MKRVVVRAVVPAAIAVLAACCADSVTAVGPRPPSAEVKDLATPEEGHLKNVRQLTFGGDNAEAY
jgi:hypothetical protein